MMGSRIYVGGAQFGNAIVGDRCPAAQSVIGTIPTADGVRPLEISPDGKTVYAALSHLIGFVVADPLTRKITRTVELSKIPDGVPDPYLATYTHSLMLSPDAKDLWITDCCQRSGPHRPPLGHEGNRADPRRQVSALVHDAKRSESGVRQPVGIPTPSRRFDVATREGHHEHPVSRAQGTGPKRIAIAKKP